METIGRSFPDLPEMGQEEKWYGKVAHKADKEGDPYKRSAYKVAQYVTCGLAPGLTWPERVKFFEHALKKHTVPVPPIDEEVWAFYEKLKDLVRAHAGPEVLKLAREQDAELTERKGRGEVRFRLTSDAASYFRTLVPASGEKPDYLSDADFQQLIAIRNKWA